MAQSNSIAFSRRQLLAAAGAGVSSAWVAPAFAVIRREATRPQIVGGVQSGDVLGDRAMVWSRCDRPARLRVEWDTSNRFAHPRRLVGPSALEPTDFTARLDLSELPAGETIFYRVQFQDLTDLRNLSEPMVGRFRTPPATRRDVMLAWGGDTAGQGWGIDAARGGMTIYRTMQGQEPDLFLHSGDMIYADGPLQAEVKLDDGSLWRNLMTPEKAQTAVTLDQFRGNFRYNLLDTHLRDFNAHVAQIVQWDDHETTNNWYPGERFENDSRYAGVTADLLAARGRRAFLDYTPLRLDPTDPERIYRAFRYGPSLELFVIDERSYRGPNTPTRQATASAETDMLGPTQIRWLKSRLLASTATWKIIASDMPLGLVVRDGDKDFEAWANGDGPASGRELELAGLLRFLKENQIRNLVWLTADVHYTAAHYYDPARARFTEFDPFWEFVAGPLHAGTFGPGELDNTFGPQAKFIGIPAGMKPNRPPSEGYQFFGTVRLDGKNETLTVALWNAAGKRLYQVELAPTL